MFTVGLSCALFAPGWIFEHEFDCHYSAEYLEKEAYFWHNTVSEVKLSGQMELSLSPSCVAFYVQLALVVQRIERRAWNRLLPSSVLQFFNGLRIHEE